MVATLWAENAAMSAAVGSIRAADLKRHVDALADDTFEGRAAGTRGGRAAGNYLVTELKKSGLRPAGEGGFFQSYHDEHRNILAVREGSDPELKSQYILIGAHYDHVGYGSGGNSLGPAGYIHNGADDNASGTAALLELIEAFDSSGMTHRRSILFALWDGEELGMLGSRHWIEQPTVPLKDVKFVINLDMLGRLRKERLMVHGIRTSHGLRRMLSEHNRATNLSLNYSWLIKQNSDHHPFYERDIPFVMFHTGLHDDYHRPSDDAHLINNEGIEQITRFILPVITDLADRDEVPRFRAAARQESEYSRRELERARAPLPPRFGVRWETEPSEVPGVVLESVTYGSPADQAGLRRGDRVVRFNEVQTVEPELLRSAVAASPAEAIVVVDREGSDEPLSLAVQLDGSPYRLGLSWRGDSANPGLVVLSRVVPASPAADAGLRVADRIYQFNGHDFAGTKEFGELARDASGTIELLMERRGRLETVSIDVLSNPSVEEREATAEAVAPTLDKE